MRARKKIIFPNKDVPLARMMEIVSAAIYTIYSSLAESHIYIRAITQ